MIIVFPLISSKNVSPNILPGVCKSIEKYLLVYKLDQIMEQANKRIKKSDKRRRLKYKSGMLKLESVDHIDEQTTHPPRTQPGKKTKATTATTTQTTTPATVSTRGGGLNIYGSTATQTAASTTGDIDIRIPPPPKPPKGARETVSVGRVNEASLTAEPTFIKVDTDEGTRIIGVKVVPFMIQHKAPLIRLLNDDRYRKGLSVTIHWQTRRILKLMFRIANRLWRNTIGLFDFTGLVSKDLYSGVLTGDWKNDIILGRTKFDLNKKKGDESVFLLLNQTDLKADFLRSAGGVAKLFGLFWPSFVIVDDVTQRAAFCMSKYKGMCSTVDYSFLYSSVSREAGQTYETIADVRRSAGPAFRMKGRVNKMIQDDLALTKLIDYSPANLLSENVLNENIKKYAMRITKSPDSYKTMLKQLANAAKSKDINKMESILKKSNIPLISVNDMMKEGRKLSKDFEKVRMLSSRVLENSLPGIPKDLNNLASGFIAAMSSGSDDPTGVAKKILLTTVSKHRKGVKRAIKKDEDWNSDMIIALIFAITTSAISVAGAIWIVSILINVIVLKGVTAILLIALSIMFLHYFVIFARKQDLM